MVRTEYTQSIKVKQIDKRGILRDREEIRVTNITGIGYGKREHENILIPILDPLTMASLRSSHRTAIEVSGDKGNPYLIEFQDGKVTDVRKKDTFSILSRNRKLTI